MVDTELPNLIHRLQAEGKNTKKLIDWRNKGLLAILFETESGASYIVEPVTGSPSMVTRLSELPPYHGEFRMSPTDTIVRRPGNPSGELEVGRCVDILGLPQRGQEFDPDSIYTTTPIIEISFIEATY